MRDCRHGEVRVDQLALVHHEHELGEVDRVGCPARRRPCRRPRMRRRSPSGPCPSSRAPLAPRQPSLTPPGRTCRAPARAPGRPAARAAPSAARRGHGTCRAPSTGGRARTRTPSSPCRPRPPACWRPCPCQGRRPQTRPPRAQATQRLVGGVGGVAHHVLRLCHGARRDCGLVALTRWKSRSISPPFIALVMDLDLLVLAVHQPARGRT